MIRKKLENKMDGYEYNIIYLRVQRQDIIITC